MNTIIYKLAEDKVLVVESKNSVLFPTHVKISEPYKVVKNTLGYEVDNHLILPIAFTAVIGQPEKIKCKLIKGLLGSLHVSFMAGNKELTFNVDKEVDQKEKVELHLVSIDDPTKDTKAYLNKSDYENAMRELTKTPSGVVIYVTSGNRVQS